MPKTGRSAQDVADRGFSPSSNRSDRNSRSRAGDNPDRSRDVLGAGPDSKNRTVTGQVRQDRLTTMAQRQAKQSGVVSAAVQSYMRTGIKPTGESLGVLSLAIPGAGWGSAAIAIARSMGANITDAPPGEGRDNQNEGSMVRQAQGSTGGASTPQRTLTASTPAASPRRGKIRQLFQIHSRSLVR